MITALRYSNEWCCDRHEKCINFLQWFNSSPPEDDLEDDAIQQTGSKAARRPKGGVRPVRERPAFEAALRVWRGRTLQSSAFRCALAETDILSDDDIKVITRLPRRAVDEALVTEFIERDGTWKEMWARSLSDAINSYNSLSAVVKTEDNDTITMPDVETRSDASSIDVPLSNITRS
jgi:hypothetical protein